MQFPIDNRLREDIGLLPLAEPPSPPQRFTPPPPSPYFPTDDRLRDDIGLPPIGDGASDDRAARSLCMLIHRMESLRAALARIVAAGVDNPLTALTAILQARHHTRSR
jgi:hypothetical protein